MSAHRVADVAHARELREAAAMLLAERLRCAGATPKQRAEWAEYVSTFQNEATPRRAAAA